MHSACHLVLSNAAEAMATFLTWFAVRVPLPDSFEGVTREDIPHGMGVMIFGNGTGGGFQFRDVKVRDDGLWQLRRH